jgi:hypothetical protein
MKTKVKRRKAVSTGIERICAHYIDWRLDDRDIQLSDMDIEHIQNCLIENYVQGELCTISPKGKTVWGWWNIQI